MLWYVELTYNGRVEGSGNAVATVCEDLAKVLDTVDILTGLAVRSCGNGAIYIKRITIEPLDALEEAHADAILRAIG